MKPWPHLSSIVGRRRIRAFSLMELVVVVAIIGMILAISAPVMASMISGARMDAAVSRLKGAFIQTQTILADVLTMADRRDTSPRITGGRFDGVAMVVRWDDTRGEYEIFQAQNNQAAKTSAGVFLESMPPANPGEDVGEKGYSRVAAFEPLTLGRGVRVVGLRRNDANPSGLEIIPDNFAICLSPSSTAVPIKQMVYVNLQTDNSALAGQWNMTPYSGGALSSASTGEGFKTSLPVMIVYDESSAAGLTIDSSLDPNVLLRSARGRVVMSSLQGGSPIEY